MNDPRLFGSDYSVYVRTVRLILHEKSVTYEFVPVDVFAEGGPPASYLALQPFGRIPAFEQGDFSLYETGAIARYIDEAFTGPSLQPSDPRQRARVNQIISIADAYVYPTLVWGIYVERVSKPRRGAVPDEAVIAAALPRGAVCIDALARLMGYGEWLAGPALTLADLYIAPMFDYILMAPEGRDLIGRHPNLSRWWATMAARPSMQATRPTSE